MDKFFKRGGKAAKEEAKPAPKKKSGGPLQDFTRGLVAGLLLQAGVVIAQRFQELREQSKRRTVKIEVHLKKGYEVWKKLFDEDARNRAAMCDEQMTTCERVSEKLAVVTLRGVDMKKFEEFVQNPDFAKMVEPYVEKHVTSVLSDEGETSQG